MTLTAIQPITTWFKRDQAVKALTDLAKKLGPGARMPRVRQMAESLGVTIATLDQALRELESRGVIIRKDRSGIFVAQQSIPGRIGLVFGAGLLAPTANSFRSLLMDYCRRRCIERGDRFSFFVDLEMPTDHEDGTPVPYELREALINKRLAGVLTVSPRPEQEEWLRKHDTPVVSLGREADWPHRVILDGEELIHIAAEELVRQGHREIGLLAVRPSHIDMFRRVMKSMRLKVNDSWIETASHTVKEEAGVRAAINFLARHGVNRRWTPKSSLPPALIITDDMMARGACAVFNQRGIVPGKQIKIASHGNRGSWALAEWEEDLIICEYDPQEIIDSMFSMLENLLSGTSLPEEPIYIRPHLKATTATTRA
jgi:DNA-binding LacI/PurR family transcriptional regulator